MLELSLILILLVFNGIFAMAEIAIVSSRKARLQERADAGHSGAKMALKLMVSPGRFLSTVQIGITLVGVLAGAFGGASLGGYIEPLLMLVPVLAPYAERIGFGIVVVGITYLSLIIGELVPKNLAIRNPEGIACAMAKPMDWLSRIAYPLVWVLEASTKLLMRLFGKGEDPTGPTRGEVEVLVREGMITGEVQREESDMVEGVFDLRELRAEEIMRPKPRVIFFSVDDLSTGVADLVAASRQSVFPVYQDTRDHVVGIVSLRALYASAAGGKARPMRELMSEPLFVPDNQPGLTLLDALRKAPLGAAVVTDEFGIVRGLVTLDDLLEEVMGDLPADTQAADGHIRQMGPDSWLIDGLTEIDMVTDAIEGLNTHVEAEEESFQTLAGFIVHRLERLPLEGETFDVGDFRFDIIDMDRQRIDKVGIERMKPSGQASQT
jgi:putative hemolysin